MSGTHESYRFALEHFAADGRRLGQAPVAPDFQPAREWAYFAAVRRGELPLVAAPADGEVAPLWSDALGPPHCRGIRVRASEFESAYFLPLAEREARAYVARGELAEGDAYRFRVCAFPSRHADSAAAAETEPAPAFGAEPLAEPIPLEPSRLDGFVARSEPVDEPDALGPPVFVAREVLAEACAQAARAGELETGGVLVGRLHRDPLRPEVFVEVRAQIPARHAEGLRGSFAFTPETWADADAELVRRGAGERLIGWWHSHPQFCRACPPERRAACAYARPFFSPEDAHLHRTCFPQAWQLALLVSDLPETGPVPALFGWRLGTIARRGFGVLDRARDEQEG